MGIDQKRLESFWKRGRAKWGMLFGVTVVMIGVGTARGQGAFARVEPANTTAGYLGRLLINENPFPGERGYVSEENTEEGMLAVLWVLHSRLRLIPAGYRQVQVAGVKTDDIVDVITGGGGRPQCEGFYEDGAGRFKAAPRVEERLNYLLNIANSGKAPGRFARLINYGQGLAKAYVEGGILGADRYAKLQRVGSVAVTGHAYSWMTDVDNFNPGGNFIFIPDAYDGSLGGNRFFTLRKDPK